MNQNYYTKYGTLSVSPGSPLPFGATPTKDGLNFSIYSSHATNAVLVLINRGDHEPFLEIPFSSQHMHTGDVYHMHIKGVNVDQLEYGYRFDGPDDPPNGYLFDPEKFLLDPYAKEITGRNTWRQPNYHSSDYELRSVVSSSQFDWEGDQPLNIPAENLIIYEMHVRSFTAHHSSGVRHPGTYAGMIEKIPYLQELGVNCVELLPIQEFDEFENPFTNPETGEKLVQYWGYGTFGFFAPKAGFAAAESAVNEFKQMVKAMHQAGIEVWMDVVFNHTAEGGEGGHVISFKGIDNKTWYLLDQKGNYKNYSGTGNTVNSNHPIVTRMIVDCLRYWVTEYHIDGFRFDLASAMTRDKNGTPLSDPPLIKAIAQDPILAKTKVVAEAWDAGGLYQVGSFPHYNRWSEWNGRFRDNLRQFIISEKGQTGGMVQRILGSPDMYRKSGRDTTASVNFITCHDGFSLRDLYTYNQKHNLMNGEDNRDGNNNNNSWNCGHEGETHDEQVNKLRRKLAKNGIAILLLSRGIPLINSGDELWHTKKGNNNTWGQDNDLNWLDWSSLDNDPTTAEIFRFFKLMIALRKQSAPLFSKCYPDQLDDDGKAAPEIIWHGVLPYNPDWAWHSHTLAFSFEMPGTETIVYIAMNMHWENHTFVLPYFNDDQSWFLLANTALPCPEDIHPIGEERPLGKPELIPVERRSMVILISNGSTDTAST
ncbi:MAG: isoamylase [Chloroflexota bacterium]